MNIGPETQPRRISLKSMIGNITSDFKEWTELPISIGHKHKQVLSSLEKIRQTLVLYRCYIATFKYVATYVDRNIWITYDDLSKDISDLSASAVKKSLRFKSLKYLRHLSLNLDAIMTRQSAFDHQIRMAPDSFDFYEKMSSLKKEHHRKNEIDQEVNQKLSKAHHALEKAFEYVEDYDKSNSIAVFGASILSLDKAREVWEQRLDEIERLQINGADADRIVAEVGNLTKSIYDAPILAKWINETEKRFNRLNYDQNLLADNYGKVVIQKEILDEMTSLLYSALPRLWENGQKEQLNQHLQELEAFIAMYQPELDSEIAFSERHIQYREPVIGETQQQYSRLIDLTKVFISAMDLRDPMMRTHSLNVARLAVSTGRVMNWEDTDLQSLEIAALLHDVGKIWIPDSILAKKDKLNSSEIQTMQMHPVYGAQILKTSDLFKDVSTWVYHHQEVWNGTGYPDGLKGDEIPIQSRIISICEAFDAMLSGSGSKHSLSIDQALERIKFESGTFFDPTVAEAFITAVETYEMEFLKKFVEH